MLPAAGSHYISMFTSRAESRVCSSSLLFFASFLKVRLPDQVQIPRLAWNMENNNGLFGLSAVKVKLVDGLI